MGCELRSREPTRYPVWRASAAGDVAPASRVSEGTRTPDRLDHNQELYQLSYAHRGRLNLPAYGQTARIAAGRHDVRTSARIRRPRTMSLPPPSPDSLALVTGASSGMGDQFARQLS